MDERALEAAARAAYDHNNPHMVGKQTEAWRMYIPSMRAAIAAYLEASGEARDKERLDWLERWLFERKWDGTIGRPSDWYVAGNYRHITQKMRGETFCAAIDTAMQEGK